MLTIAASTRLARRRAVTGSRRGEKTEGEFDLTSRDGLLKGALGKICLVELQSDYVALRTRLINIFVGDDDDPTEQSAGADYEISNFVCARIDDRFVQPARWLTVAGQ